MPTGQQDPGRTRRYASLPRRSLFDEKPIPSGHLDSDRVVRPAHWIKRQESPFAAVRYCSGRAPLLEAGAPGRPPLRQVARHALAHQTSRAKAPEIGGIPSIELVPSPLRRCADAVSRRSAKRATFTTCSETLKSSLTVLDRRNSRAITHALSGACQHRRRSSGGARRLHPFSRPR